MEREELVPPGAHCPTSPGLLRLGSRPFGQLGCSGLLPPQQQQLSPAPDMSLSPVRQHWPDPKSCRYASSCQG